VLGRGGHWISLVYLSAFNHILTPWSRVKAGTLAPDPVPGASILADIDQIVNTQIYGKVTGYLPERAGLRSLNSFYRPTPFSVIPSSVALRTGGALGPWRGDTKGSETTQC
jgi:hypothetical protein